MTPTETPPVSPINPKANPVLWMLLIRVIIFIGARYGVVLDDTAAAEMAQHISTAGFVLYLAVEAIVHVIVRQRVSPVHSTGEPVKTS